MEHSICPAGNTLGIEMLPHTGTKSRASSSAAASESESDNDSSNARSVNIQGMIVI